MAISGEFSAKLSRPAAGRHDVVDPATEEEFVAQDANDKDWEMEEGNSGTGSRVAGEEEEDDSEDEDDDDYFPVLLHDSLSFEPERM